MALVNSPKVNGDERMAITLTAPQQVAGTNDLGFKTPLEWFPNLLESGIVKGTEFFIQVNDADDRTEIDGAADGQQFGIIATFRKYDNGDPATGNIIEEAVDSRATTKRAGFPLNSVKSSNAIAPFEPHSIGLQVVIPTTVAAVTSLKIYAA